MIFPLSVGVLYKNRASEEGNVLSGVGDRRKPREMLGRR